MHLEDYLSFLRVEKGLSQNTISVYENNLKEFDRYLGRREFSISVKREEIKAFLFSLAEKNKPITRRLKQTSLRNYFGYLEGEDLISNNPTKNLPMPRVEILEPKYLQEREIKKLLQAVKSNKTKYKKRNELIIRILIETGIRLSELTGLDVGHINIKEKIIQVRRKGNIEQTLPINPKLNSLLRKFINRKEPNEPLLISSFRKRITNRRVSLLVQRYIKKAGIQKSGISVHSLRHSFCVRLLEKGVNIKVIQILAGHRNISATERYLHVAKSQLRKEVRKIELN